MRILVTGAKGQLGSDICSRLAEEKIEYLGIDMAECDLTDNAQVNLVFKNYTPDAVIHCAAYTAVDKAETETGLCRKVNVGATRNVVDVCKELGAKMMYISTDYVFSGEGEAAFEVDEPYKPQNVYGLTKADGEKVVREILTDYFIVRISWAFGLNGSNFVKTVRRLGKERDSLNVVSDQIGSPTFTHDLAELLVDMIGTEKYGIYHATNEGYCSWAEFARAIVSISGIDCKINPIPTAEYPLPAKRPRNSRLSKKSLDENGFKRLPSWEDALVRYIEWAKKNNNQG